MITVTKKVFLSNGRSGRKKLVPAKPAVQQVPQGRVPRISKLMALAIKYDGLLREGTVPDMSELARFAHVTQPRMTQIMNLLHLAPDIQEELLFLPEVTDGRDPIHEKMLRPMTALPSWEEQRVALASLRVDGA
ncbi:MAG: hypothetical protein BWX88_04347 [Planctomycetes bacterium ADurb.Bin126]|nr:MAG: hypothetical protein BWX88_04347 [Planctomycetes bacterium ADurb.Bin126]